MAANIFPPELQGDPSTTPTPIPIPASARVTTWSAADLGTTVLPTVGVRDRTSDEQALLDEIAKRF